MKKIKKVTLILIAILLMLLSTGCGKTYTCSSCGKKTKTVYYDSFEPNNENAYMCEDCAREYYAPFPYKSYRVK